MSHLLQEHRPSGEPFAGVRLAAATVLSLLLSAKGDGTFPLPATAPVAAVQGYGVLLGIAFAYAAYLLYRPERAPRWLAARLPREFPALSLLAGVVLATGAALTSWLSVRHYRDLGFSGDSGESAMQLGLLLAGSLSMLAFAALGLRSRSWFLAGALLSSFLFLAWSVHSFALVPARSDMLPLIAAGLERFRGGLDPYVAYGELAGVPLTYLPGMWLAYLPGSWVGLDPRATHIAALLLAVLAIHRLAGPARAAMAPLLATFVLMPYLIYRHEIYFGIFWLALVLTFLFLAEGRPSCSGAAFGWGLAASPFAWALAPLVALVLWRSRGKQATLRFCLAAGAVAGVLLLPFAVTSPSFTASVFGYWGERTNFSGFNLGFWLEPFIGLAGLRVLQLLVVAGFCLAARRCARLAELPFLAAGLLFFFFLLNSVVWVYFYPTCILLLLTGVAFRGRESAVEGSRVGRPSLANGEEVDAICS